MTDSIAPRSFWAPIERAKGDFDRFRGYLHTLSRDEMIEMYRIYRSLMLELFRFEHLAYLEDNEDVVNDVASWVVMQGEAFYLDVQAHPEKTPSRSDIGRSFSDEIVRVFAERFGEWISVAAFPPE